MAMSQSTLASELEAMLDALTSPSAPSAAAAWADAFGEYFKDAEWQGTPIITAVVDSVLKPAMEGAMVFANDGTGGAVLQSGFAAFWAP